MKLYFKQNWVWYLYIGVSLAFIIAMGILSYIYPENFGYLANAWEK